MRSAIPASIATTPKRKPTSPVVEHFAELLAPFGSVRTKRMFGGHGFYVDDCFVAIEAEQRIYLKCDEATRKDFESAGCTKVELMMNGRTMTMNYWTVPDDAFDSSDALAPWFRRALGAALRARGAAGTPRSKPAVARTVKRASPKRAKSSSK